MGYHYNFTNKAKNDLNLILQYMKDELCSNQAMQNFLKKLMEKLEEICSFPKSEKIIENTFLFDKQIRRALVNNYILYYQEDENKKAINVLRIVYSKMNLKKVDM